MTDDQPERDQEPVPAPQESPEPERIEETQEAPTPEPEEAPRASEDALAAVRQSLREEEQAKKPGFFARLSGIFRRKPKEEPEAETEELSELDDLAGLPGIPRRREPEEEPREPRFAALRPPAAEAAVEAAPEPEPPAIPEPAIEPPQAPEPESLFTPLPAPEEEPEQPRGSILKGLREEEGVPEEPVDYAAIRGEALEGYVEHPEEPVGETQVSMQRTMRRAWRDMRPAERFTIGTAVFVIVIAIVIGIGYLLLKSAGLLPAAPVPTSTPSDIPFPTGLSLPGVPEFRLRTGRVQDKKWEPTSPEWLEGTEVCRWVALPWNVQLEAVVRTLKADDQITLTMSDYSKVTYKVRAIEQVTPDRIQGLQTEEPCLLVILSNPDSDQRWVVRANP